MKALRQSSLFATAVGLAVLLVFVALGSDPVDVSTKSGAIDTDAAVNDKAAEPVHADVLAEVETFSGASTSLQTSGFSGDAELDLREGARGVIIIPDLVAGVQQREISPPNPDLPPLFEMGWDIKDVRVKYVAVTDELIIALNSYGIVGDPDGNGDPASFDPRWTNANIPGTDNPDLGTSEGVTFVLDLDSDGTYDVAVGTHFTNDINNFGVHEYLGANPPAPLGPRSYGDRLGALAKAPNSPTADAPDLIFSIADFSKLPGNDSSLDFGINVMNGSGGVTNLGDDSIGDFDVAVPVHLDSEIGDAVWSDTNKNGIQDSGEPGIPNVQVNLRNAADAVLAQTVTDSAGEYRFLVPSGNYVVEFIAPSRGVFTRRFATGDESIDSDADPRNGRTSVVTVETGEADLTVDAGIVEFVPSPSVDIETFTEGEDADSPSGPELDVGSTVTFTYVVTNTGNLPLTNIVVTDSRGVAVTCSPGDLDVGDSKGCTASTTVTEGPYRTVGAVVALPGVSDEDDFEPVTDEDPSNHVGVIPFVPAPSIDIETFTNGDDADEAPGPTLIVGETATFTYVLENTGNVDLIEIAVTDDILGVVCAVERLVPTEQAKCASITTVTEGKYANVGSVEAVAISALDVKLETVTDEDSSHHFGAPGGPACVTNTHGPRMYAGGTVRDETGFVAAAGSTIIIVTSEPGGSPDQPHEQVYVQVGEDLYGPTPVGLGRLEIAVANTGPVTILHHSVVNDDTTRSNSVEYDWCGTELTIPSPHTCPATLSGPRMYKGGITTWDTELVAAPGSTISITTSEPGGSPGQPHEQVYVQVGDEQFGPTPNEHTTTTFEVDAGGRVVVQHYSVINDDSNRANSVEVEICGSHLAIVR